MDNTPNTENSPSSAKNNDNYSMLETILSKEQIEEQIDKKISEFHGLLTREVAIKMIAKERGLLKDKEQFFKINDIKPGARKINLVAKIGRINKEVIHPSGKRSRGMLIKDDTGGISLTLWNDDLEFFKKLKVGDELLVKNAYEKYNSLSLGYNGTLEITSPSSFTKLSDIENGNYVHVKEFISRIEGKKSYEKDKQKRSFFSFYVKDGKSEKQCIIWENIERGEKLDVGDEIIIENVFARNNELHINDSTRLLVKKHRDLVSGILYAIECSDGIVSLTIGKNELKLDRNNALKFFGVEANEDIAIATIANLKKSSMLNKNMYVRGKKNDKGLFILE